MAPPAQTAQVEVATALQPVVPRPLPAWVPTPRDASHQPIRLPPAAATAALPAYSEAVATSIVQSMLDSMQVGAMAVGAGLRVAFANRAAAHECRRLGLMQTDDASVALLAWADGADRQRLAQAVATAHAGQYSMVRLGGRTQPLTIAVFPLCHDQRGAGPMALLLFGLSPRHEPLAVQLYARSCGLTPAETRVLLGLSEGLLPKQIAGRHGVLLSTVRTQISAIRDKTGARRLADLLQTLTMLPPIMPAPLGRA